MDWPVIAGTLSAFAQRLKVCMLLLAISVWAGFVSSLPQSVGRVSSRRRRSAAVWLFIDGFRGKPLRAQLFFVCRGSSGWRLHSRILLPGAMRRALPRYSNEVADMIHAIASASSLVDVTRVARDVCANHVLPTQSFATAADICFAFTLELVDGFKLQERLYLRHLSPERRTAQPSPAAAAAASAP